MIGNVGIITWDDAYVIEVDQDTVKKAFNSVKKHDGTNAIKTVWWISHWNGKDHGGEQAGQDVFARYADRCIFNHAHNNVILNDKCYILGGGGWTDIPKGSNPPLGEYGKGNCSPSLFNADSATPSGGWPYDHTGHEAYCENHRVHMDNPHRETNPYSSSFNEPEQDMYGSPVYSPLSIGTWTEMSGKSQSETVDLYGLFASSKLEDEPDDGITKYWASCETLINNGFICGPGETDAYGVSDLLGRGKYPFVKGCYEASDKTDPSRLLSHESLVGTLF